MRSACLSILAGLALAAGADAAVVLRVNGVAVTDYALRQAKRTATISQQGQPVDEAAVLRAAVDQVVGHVLLVQAAREAGVTVDPAEAQRRVGALKARYPDAAAFAQALREQGTDEAELLRFEEDNLLIARFSQALAETTVKVTAADARRYYEQNPQEFDHPEQVKVRMILAAVPEGASEAVEAAAKIRIDEAARRLAKGEDFGKLAAELSDDPSKSRGGEVGWVRPGQLLPELDPEVFALQPGAVTKPLKTRYGYHVMGVMDRRAAGRSSYEEVETTLMGMLRSLQVRTLLQGEVEKRRAAAKVETLDPAIRALFTGADGS